MRDGHRKTGQRSRPRAEETQSFLSPAEAAARLGVARRTLYTYASRGLLRRAREGRSVRYLAEDVRRLALRADAHRGHTAVAAGALRWGAPVLESAITEIADGRVAYRGHDAVELAARATFEEVADLLLGGPPGPWPRRSGRRGGHAAPIRRMLVEASDLAAGLEARAHDAATARAVIARLAAALGARGPGRIAARLGRALDLDAGGVRALEAALVLVADHELNASTFVARIATSAGASPGAAVLAALATFTGRRHGAACTRIEELLRATPVRGMAAALGARLARGESIPGFGHPLHPGGDPRTAPLLAHAEACAIDRSALRHALGVRGWVEARTGVPASVDFGLVALLRALGVPDGHAVAIFALGRSAGWLAHAIEARGAGELLRPRARYVGPARPDGAA